MGKIKISSIKLQITISILCVLFSIAAMQSYYNLQRIILNPSENWGRSITLKEQIPNKKSAAIHLTDELADLLIVDGKKFENITLTRNNGQFSNRIIDIENAHPEKVSNMDWCKNYVVWMENYDLYYSAINADGAYSEKKLIHTEVKGFQLSKGDGERNLIVAKENSLAIYRLSNGIIEQIGLDYELPNANGVDFVKDNSGTLHIAAYSSDNGLLYPMKYLTFKDGNWKLVAEQTEKYLSRAWTITGIDIGIDNDEVYIFYQLRKWDSFGIASRVYISKVPLNTTTGTMKFDQLSIFEEEKHLGSTFISDVNCIKGQKDILQFAVVKDSYDVKIKDGFTIYLLSLDNGNIIKREKMTQEMKWISSLYLSSNNDDIAISFLDTAGKGLSEVLYTDNNKNFIQAVSKPKSKDLLYAFLDIIPGYIVGLFMGLVRSFVFIPAIVWILFIEFFEIRKLRRRPIFVNRIAIIIYMIIKFLTMGSYYTQYSKSVMPSILKFVGAPYFYAVLTICISILITNLYKKAKPDMHNIAEFLIFILLDIVTTTFLFTTYLT